MNAPSEIEVAPRERLEALQLERLRAVVDRLLERVAPARERLNAAGVTAPGDIATLDDVAGLPFTTKAQLRDHYPFGLLAVAREQLVRIHASSGTGGRPTVVGYTRTDLETWTELMARCLRMAGVHAGMVVHNAYGYGLFTGGLGFHQGAERLGATVVPVSGGATSRQVALLHELRAQALFATPSYALRIAHAVAEAGLGPDDLALEVGVFGGEAWTPALGAEIELGLGLTALNMYGLSEMIGPGVAAECLEGRAGSHLNEDHFLAEVVDPATGARLAPGEEGEIVLTALTKEALPLVRYRTGDVATIHLEPCACGRTLARMSAVRGRCDDMLTVRGVNLYPSEIEAALLTVDGLSPHYQIVVERPAALDELTIACEPAADGIDVDALAARVAQTLRERTGLTIGVSLLERGAVSRSEGKAVRVVDRRAR